MLHTGPHMVSLAWAGPEANTNTSAQIRRAATGLAKSTAKKADRQQKGPLAVSLVRPKPGPRGHHEAGSASPPSRLRRRSFFHLRVIQSFPWGAPLHARLGVCFVCLSLPTAAISFDRRFDAASLRRVLVSESGS